MGESWPVTGCWMKIGCWPLCSRILLDHIDTHVGVLSRAVAAVDDRRLSLRLIPATSAPQQASDCHLKNDGRTPNKKVITMVASGTSNHTGIYRGAVLVEIAAKVITAQPTVSQGTSSYTRCAIDTQVDMRCFSRGDGVFCWSAPLVIRASCRMLVGTCCRTG